MKRRGLALPIIALCATFWLAFAVAAAPTPDANPTETEAVAGCSTAGGTNLLYNPSFEGQYSAYIPPGGHPDCPDGICNTAQMAAGWTPYWRSHDPNDEDWIIRMPEYKPATLGVPGPLRVHSGERAQQYFTFFSTHEAGFYQRVSVTPGQSYCFSIWGHSWSSSDDDPDTSDMPLQQRIGIDPTGGTDWQSPTVIWSPPFEQYNVYGQFSHSAVAQATQMTVFVYSLPIWAAKHNDVYWDDAALVSLNTEPASLSITPDQLLFIAATDDPDNVQQTISISLTGSSSIMWQATVDTSGGLAPTLSAYSGGADDDLTVTVNGADYELGQYTATITLSTNLPATGSPVDVSVRLLAISEVHMTHFPIVSQP